MKRLWHSNRRLIAKSGADSSISATSINRGSEILRVLIVDDSKTIRSSVQRILHPRGVVVLTAADGFAALCVVERQQPDIIFLDLMMPRLDGYQTCALLKRHQEFRRIPVVMLSSKDGVIDRARGRIAGSEHYLSKPISSEGLLGAIEAHVELTL